MRETTRLPAPALIVPGIGNSGAQHWQTLWQLKEPQWRRVVQRDWDHPECAEWVRALDDAMAAFSTPPVLLAHSIGCLVVARWAAQATVPVRAALLVAVPDPKSPRFPSAAKGFHPPALRGLPFPSLVVASTDDPFGSVAHARRCAAAWGSECMVIGAAGHINVESGHGPWLEGRVLLDTWLKRTTPATHGQPPST
jgi:predicted alpha/beta hydrolase family esterase